MWSASDRTADASPGDAGTTAPAATAAGQWRAIDERHLAEPARSPVRPRTAANRKWIADFTYIWTAEGWLYVAAVVDLFSRRVVGWSMSATMTAQLVTDALMMAIWRRGKPDALMHHSDRGSQHTCEPFQRLMAEPQRLGKDDASSVPMITPGRKKQCASIQNGDEHEWQCIQARYICKTKQRPLRRSCAG